MSSNRQLKKYPRNQLRIDCILRFIEIHQILLRVRHKLLIEERLVYLPNRIHLQHVLITTIIISIIDREIILLILVILTLDLVQVITATITIGWVHKDNKQTIMQDYHQLLVILKTAMWIKLLDLQAAQRIPDWVLARKSPTISVLMI